MKLFRNHCWSGLFFSFLLLSPVSAQPVRPFDDKVVDAWRKAGASVGWMESAGHFSRQKPDADALPALEWYTDSEVALAKLPAP